MTVRTRERCVWADDFDVLAGVKVEMTCRNIARYVDDKELEVSTGARHMQQKALTSASKANNQVTSWSRN